MRAAAILLSALLALMPLALAQDGGDSSSNSSTSSTWSHSSTSSRPPPSTDCSQAEHPEECKERYCRNHPDSQDCKEYYCRTHPDAGCRDPGEGPPPACPGSASACGRATVDCSQSDDPDDCRDGEVGSRVVFCFEDGNKTEDEKERCELAEKRIRQQSRREWITFQVAANATLVNYTIGDLRALDSLVLGVDGGNLSIERHGSLLQVRAGTAELRLHDEPNGLMRFKSDSGNITLDFPAGATIERNEHGARIVYGERQGHLKAENATWVANDTVRLHGFFAFHVPPDAPDRLQETGVHVREPPAPGSGPGNVDLGQLEGARADASELEARRQRGIEVQAGVRQAIERGTFGAEIHLKPRPMEATLATADDSVEVLAYDDVDVDVDLPDAGGAPGAQLRVVVSAELDEGRTITVSLDEALLASSDPADLTLRYYDLHDQTDGTTLETEVILRPADSLQDVLDPVDDSGQPEFWVVEDVNGLQVLVSVPHWSAHAITVSSVASIQTVITTPSVVAGIVAGVATSTLLGFLLLWPRRRDDDL